MHPAQTTAWPRHRWGIGAFVLVEAVFLLTGFALALFLGDGSLSAGLLAMAIVIPAVVAAALALLITAVRGNGPTIDLRVRWSWRDVGIGFAFGFGGWLIVLPASFIYMQILGDNATSAVGEIFSDVQASLLGALLVMACVTFVVPICEEILYRGLLWGALEQRWGRVVAAVVSTIVFALAHFEPQRTPLLLIVAIPIALARFYSGSLIAGIVAHQANNLLPGLVVMLGLLGAFESVS